MSSRTDHRRRERSWEREDRDRDKYRDRDRYSRSSKPSTYRDGGRRRDSRSRSPRRDRPDYDREKDKDRDHKYSRRDDRRDHDRGDHREDERRSSRRDGRRDYEVPDRVSTKNLEGRSKDVAQRTAPQLQDGHADRELVAERIQSPPMMAAMGLSSFGSTKGKHVEGNQEGSVNVKKIRTWRQYMNRRGGFNRPLDKIK
ncbi:hypothetical protein F5J12DRAFT_903569 [Pisolithus orientalis]|uniref:uncharacterized protein n=1 Tax=Pisolithus orientalis TaxID=936130 RepID=UPI0022248E72|nr:uncharacterized protein F5J12DRAFT_903569 [Pisolithus orientalis]KAI6028619.1 hypothetical protein F5J12DRAFT_903569 [Pisolithus orientalis]